MSVELEDGTIFNHCFCYMDETPVFCGHPTCIAKSKEESCN